MKKVININFQGRVVPIEESSYEMLQQYIETLRKYFETEEGRDEIINDIESRISELFQERLKDGATCITDEHVQTIMKNIGRPEDFDEENGEKTESTDSTYNRKETHDYGNHSWNYRSKKLYRDENHKILGGVCSGVAAYVGIDPVIVRIIFIFSGIGLLAYLILWIFVPSSNAVESGIRKRLYRNPDSKIIGGVCSGLGSYFDINPWIPRVIFLLPFISFMFRWSHFGFFSFPNFIGFSFSPGTVLIYIILWLVIPEASTTTEKLQMKGEKIDLDSIKRSVMEEMKGVGERVGKMGVEAGKFARDKGPEIGHEIHQVATRSSGALGNIITTLFKVFMYVILGCIAFALIVGIFSLALFAIGYFPLKNYLLYDGWQNLLAWGSLIFFIGVPVVGILTFLIRRLARIKRNSKFMWYSFWGLWIVGIVCFVGLLISVSKDFRGVSSFSKEQAILTNPTVKSLEVKPNDNVNLRRMGWLRIEPFGTYGIGMDTAFIGNVHLIITQSPTDSFQVSYIRVSNGPTTHFADKLASLIRFHVTQQDAVLSMDNAIAINTTDKFRNQFVEVTIAVPIGHKIRIDKPFRYRNRVRFSFSGSNYGWYSYNRPNSYFFKYGVEYTMKRDGLYTLEDGKSDENDEEDRVRDDNYRYNGSGDSNGSNRSLHLQNIQSQIDSLKAVQENERQRIQDSLQHEKDKIDEKLEKISKGTATILEPEIPPHVEKLPTPFVNYI